MITEAGNEPSVAAVVYIAVHMPDAGEKELELGKKFPSDLAKSGAVKKTPEGFTFVDPAQFPELFAADLPDEQAALMARSQVMNFDENFSATITTAAWRTKPSWMMVAAADRTINPAAALVDVSKESYGGCGGCEPLRVCVATERGGGDD